MLASNIYITNNEERGELMASYFPPAVKEKVKREISVADLLKEYTDENIYKDGNIKCIKPDHQTDDTVPSMHYYPDDDNLHCYGCNTNITDSISFMQEIEGMSFKKAVLSLAERIGLDISDQMELSDREKRRIKLKRKVNRDAVKFHEILRLRKHNDAEDVAIYLHERGFTNKAIDKFQIGYCPRDKRIDKTIYKGLQDRIIIPIYDEYGDVIGFSGRVLPGDDRVKYCNISKKNIPFFNKNTPYGIHVAKHNIPEKGFAYIFEGFMDTLLAYEQGVDNSVAVMGTGVKQEHLDIISRYTNKIIMYLDPDEAGLNAVNKTIDVFEDYGLSVKVIYAKDGKDPAEKAQELGDDFDDWAQDIAKPPEQMYIDLNLDEFNRKKERAYQEYKSKVNDYINDFLLNLSEVFNGKTDRLEVEFFLKAAVENMENMNYETLIKRMKKIQEKGG